MADGRNFLEAFSNEKIPGNFRRFKTSSPTHSHEEDEGIYANRYLDFTQNKQTKMDARKNGLASLEYANSVGNHPLRSHMTAIRH